MTLFPEIKKIQTAFGLAVGLMILLAPALQAEDTAVERIENFHTALLQAMKSADDSSYEERRALLQDDVYTAFDFPFMVRVASAGAWQTFSEGEKQGLTDAFRDFTLTNYAARFNGYSGQEFRTIGTEDAGRGRIFVSTELVRPEQENIKLDYLMRETDGAWKIMDVYLKGQISELALRRSEFGPILRDHGIAGLISMLENKISSMEEDTAG